MPFFINDYLIDQRGIEWPKVLQNWSWMLPSELTVWMVNRFADLFLVFTDGTVHMLNVGAGTVTKLAEHRDDFVNKIDENDNADDWLLIPLANELVATGVTLKPGQCYGFKMPPILGGEYRVENLAPLAIEDYLGAYASIHGQLREVPDGTQVVLKPVNVPPK